VTDPLRGESASRGDSVSRALPIAHQLRLNPSRIAINAYDNEIGLRSFVDGIVRITGNNHIGAEIAYRLTYLTVMAPVQAWVSGSALESALVWALESALVWALGSVSALGLEWECYFR